MWAGIHWRSDHVFGQLVGRAVAEPILGQLEAARIVAFVSAADLGQIHLPYGLKYMQPTVFVTPLPLAGDSETSPENPCAICPDHPAGPSVVDTFEAYCKNHAAQDPPPPKPADMECGTAGAGPTKG